ncbi:arginine-tRNA-protein transferase [Spirosoma flavum]|uniref:Arginine-tRNA-protein transferase n=1 Tax=Spirosoma flavum TaxID=2048557 RepID=A0ABW6ARA5_9BACT
MEGSELDLFLSIGYFRMQQEIFTCQYILFDDTRCAVHWLRIALAAVTYGPKQSRLLRINERFSVTVKPFILSEEIETLYALYKSTLNFDAPDSVEFWLLNGAAYTTFDTYVIEVRDENRLIAVGIFDNGERSIAGIMNFYHPEYHRHSLGKYLMLLKINYAQLQQKEYYYPGYLVSNYPKFDYKLFPCEAATEVFNDRTGQWLPFSWETVTTLTANRLDEN